MRLPDNLTYDNCVNGNHGDWWWVNNESEIVKQNVSAIIFLVARKPLSGAPENSDTWPIRVYTQHHENDWCTPGPVNGGDGNINAPTLKGSINAPGIWHDFMEKGKIRHHTEPKEE